MAQKAVAAAMAQGLGSLEQTPKSSQVDNRVMETGSKLKVIGKAVSQTAPDGKMVLAAPLHLQRVQRALCLAPVVDYVEDLFSRSVKQSWSVLISLYVKFGMCLTVRLIFRGQSNGLIKAERSIVEKGIIDQGMFLSLHILCKWS